MKKLLLWMGLLAGLGSTATAQVKIGDNPNTINTNSMLELESTNKGFLQPRVALGSLTAVSPLSGTVPAGMQVYSIGGSVPDGQYTWTGSRWLATTTSDQLRDSTVIVKSAADFPAPVSGVVSLVPGFTYVINGIVPMTSKINMNGCTIRGFDRTTDKLVYTPSTGELFTGSTGGIFNNVVLSAPASGAKLFNVDAAGDLTKFLIMENTYIFNCADIGKIKGFGGFVVFTSVAYSGNLSGIIFENIGDLLEINAFWVPDNHGIHEKFVGTFGTIQMQGGRMATMAFFSGVGMDITGITSITYGASVKDYLFSGDGTYVSGTFSSKWEVESIGVNTEKDAAATANVYISSAATTTISAANTPVKVAGTTTTAALFRMISTGNNKIVYMGSKTRRFAASCALSASFPGGGSNRIYSFYVAKNGTVLPESKQTVKLINSSDQTSISLGCTVSMAPGDYLEIWVENNTDATNIVVETMNMYLH